MTTNNEEITNDAIIDHQTKEEKVMDGEEKDTTTFADVGVVDVLVKACESLGWRNPTPIQKAVLPEALKSRDIIGLAETGSGKTAAFCLPILQGLLLGTAKQQARGTATSAVILTPTRELAVQISNVVQALGESIAATSTVIVGGMDRVAQAVALAKFPHIIIATPGRLLDHLRDTKGFQLRHVRYLVLDEADRMLSMDFEQELHAILDELPNANRQTMLFSATMTDQVQKLQRASLKDPVKIQVSTSKFQTPKNLLQYYLFIPAKYKDCYLTYLVNEYAGQSILVFCATCNNVQRLGFMLRNLGFAALTLHGQMRQNQRLGALHKFSSGQRTILLCTDVASRGLDLPNVDVVINFDLPGHGKEYIHRVGRTARAGKSGKALAMVTQYDVEVYQRIEGLLGQKLPEYKLEEDTVLVLLERVCEAQRLATRELKEQQQQNSGGLRHRKKRNNHGDDEFESSENNTNQLESSIARGLKSGYKGGSGGRGGALHNQRGASHKNKKHKQRHSRSK